MHPQPEHPTTHHPAATRVLPIAPGQVPALIGRLRAEPGPQLWQWQLGDHGSVVLHWFHICPAGEPTLALATGALRDPLRRTRTDIVVSIEPIDGTRCAITLRAAAPATDATTTHPATDPAAAALLRRAAVDEIAEELAWYARPARRAA